MRSNMKPVSVIKASLGLTPNGDVQRYFTHRCRVHMDKYVPYENGGLRVDSVEEGADYVKYDIPYAHYMYEGILYVDPVTGSSWARKNATKVPTSRYLKFHTPGTGRHWDQLMWSAEKDQVISEVQRYIERK